VSPEPDGPPADDVFTAAYAFGNHAGQKLTIPLVTTFRRRVPGV
jgi:hypothetical protein